MSGQHITQARIVSTEPQCWFVWFCEDVSTQIVMPLELVAANDARSAA